MNMMMRQVSLIRSSGPAVRSAVIGGINNTSCGNSGSSTGDRSYATAPNPSLDLKAVLAKKIVEHQKRVKEFRTVYGSKGLGEVTVEQVSPFIFPDPASIS